MRSFSITPARPYSIMVAVFVTFLMAVFGIIATTQAHAASNEEAPAGSGRLISIHSNGTTKGILTDATTLREAFKQAGIAIDEHDLVEPGLDQELVASQYDVNVYRARPITIIDGAVRMRVVTPYQTTDQIARQAGIELQDEDITQLRAGVDARSHSAELQMTIDRATPFTLVLYGKKIRAYTQGETVEAMLKEKSIKLSSNDFLSVSKDMPIRAGMTVELWREGKQVITEEEAVDFPVEKITDMDREIGYRAIKTPGEKGKRTVSYEVIMKNGKEVSRKEIRSVTTKQPKKQIETVGGKMTNTFNGSFAEALARLRSCEGAYTSNTGNGYYGAYQYDLQTWGGYKGYANASLAPPNVQDEKAWLTYQARGWQPWPSCRISQGLQDIYR